MQHTPLFINLLFSILVTIPVQSTCKPCHLLFWHITFEIDAVPPETLIPHPSAFSYVPPVIFATPPSTERLLNLPPVIFNSPFLI